MIERYLGSFASFDDLDFSNGDDPVSTGVLKSRMHAEGVVGLVKKRQLVFANSNYAMAA